MSTIRRLTSVEEAFTLANEFHPLSVVSILHLDNSPDQKSIRNALDQLQDRHPLLKAGITGTAGKRYFTELVGKTRLSLSVKDKVLPTDWQSYASQALNTHFDRSGPLMRAIYIQAKNPHGRAELILIFHHAIGDGGGLRLLLHELLSLIGGVPLPPSQGPVNLMLQPEFPEEYRRFNSVKGLASFMFTEIRTELRMKRKGIHRPIPNSSRNGIISLSLPLDLSRRITLKAAKDGISLNSLLAAATLHAAFREFHPGKSNKVARAIAFADLRDLLEPAAPESYLGCHASMLRFSLPMQADSTLSILGKKLWKEMYASGKTGRVIYSAKLSFRLIRMALNMKKMRLGNTALSFLGKLDLLPEYGEIKLAGVNAYITNNQFGPEFSGFGKVLFGQIGLDYTYLTSETSSEQAEKIVSSIRASLEKF